MICFLNRPQEVQGMGNYKHTYAASKPSYKNIFKKNLANLQKNNIS